MTGQFVEVDVETVRDPLRRSARLVYWPDAQALPDSQASPLTIVAQDLQRPPRGPVASNSYHILTVGDTSDHSRFIYPLAHQ